MKISAAELEKAMAEVESFNLRSSEAVKTMPPLRLGNFLVEVSSFHQTLVQNGVVIPEHQHPNYEFSFCREGMFTAYCDELKVICSGENKTIFFLPPAILHHKIHAKSDYTHTISMVLMINGSDEAGQQLIPLFQEYVLKKKCCFRLTSNLENIFNEIRFQIEHPTFLSREAIASLIHSFITLFFQQNFSSLMEPETLPESSPEAVSRRSRIADIKLSVVTRMNAKTTLKDFEESFKLSGRHLNRIFKKETGLSLMQYYLQMKLKNAQNLLSDTDIPVSEIAKSLQFKSAAYFSVFFRQHCHCSPSEYRELHRPSCK